MSDKWIHVVDIPVIIPISYALIASATFAAWAVFRTSQLVCVVTIMVLWGMGIVLMFAWKGTRIVNVGGAP